MKKLIVALVMVVLFVGVGCYPKADILRDGDYEAFTHWSYGHPAVTTVVITKCGKQVYANSHAGKAVGLELSNDFATMASGLIRT